MPLKNARAMIAPLLISILLLHQVPTSASIQLQVLGDNGDPADAYPLPECAGDCDEDSDCAEGLICFQRDVGEDVPGCLGGTDDNTRSDFCIRDPSSISSNTTSTSTTPPNTSNSSTASPTSLTLPIPNEASFQTVAVSDNVVIEVFISAAKPLPLCAGDCDEDSDCEQGLICFFREAWQEAPGCTGGVDDKTTTDYCVQGRASNTTDASSPTSTSTLPSSNEASAQVGIASQNVSTSPQPSEAPTKSSTSAPATTSRPTFAASQAPTKGSASAPATTSRPTLAASQAPTKSSASAPTTTSRPTLAALRTSGPTKISTAKPSPGPTPSPTLQKGPFQIRMHWEPSFCWQGECDTHWQWCMQCEGYRCNQGDVLWAEPCRPDQPPMQLFDWIPIEQFRGTTPSLRTTTTTYVFGQIRSALSFPLLCLEHMESRHYTLQECNAENTGQWFSGFDPTIPFELHEPPSATAVSRGLDPDGRMCLTTPHHPRQFETIIHHSCDEAESVNTNLWEAIYDWKDSDISGSTFDPERYYRLGDRRSNPKCQASTPCGLCQGHCISDDDCEGSLKCFERNRSNPEQTPPGCYGRGVPRT
jgi:hypothetical protein